jgi:hypothetical protein
MGVHSLSDGQPIKSGNFSEANGEFAEKNSYKEWHFKFVPVVTSTGRGQVKE